MSTNRTINVSELRLIGEEVVHIATVEERVPLALAVAYLFPPKHTGVALLNGNPNAPLTFASVSPGWEPATKLKTAIGRMNAAAAALDGLDALASRGEVEGSTGPAPRHEGLVVVGRESVTCDGQVFTTLPDTKPVITPHLSLRRDGDVVVLTTRYTAMCVPRS